MKRLSVIAVITAVVAGSVANVIWLHEGPLDFAGELFMLALIAGAIIGILALIDYRYRCISFKKAWRFVAVVMAVIFVANFTMSAMLAPLKDDFNNQGGDHYQSVFQVVEARNDFLRQHDFIIIGRWWHSDNGESSYSSFGALYFWLPPAAHAEWYPRTRDDFDPNRGKLY